MVFFPFSPDLPADVMTACLQELIDDPMFKDDELSISEARVCSNVLNKLKEVFRQPHQFRIISLNECNGHRLNDLVEYVLTHTPVEKFYIDRCDMNTSYLLRSLTTGINATITLRELWVTPAHLFDPGNHDEEYKAFLGALVKVSPYLKVFELNHFDVTTSDLQDDLAAALFPTPEDVTRFKNEDDTREAAAAAAEERRIAAEEARKARFAAYLEAQQKQLDEELATKREAGEEDESLESQISEEFSEENGYIEQGDGAYVASLDSFANEATVESDDQDESTLMIATDSANSKASKGDQKDPQDVKPAAAVAYRAPAKWERIFVNNSGEYMSGCSPTGLLTRLVDNVQHTCLHWLGLNGHTFTPADMDLLVSALVGSDVQRLSMRSCSIPSESWPRFFSQAHNMTKLARADFGKQPKRFSIAIWEALRRALCGGLEHEPCVTLGYIGTLPSLPVVAPMPRARLEEEEDGDEEDEDDEDDERHRTAAIAEREEAMRKRQLYGDIYGRLDMNRLGCTRSQTTMTADEWATVLSRLVNNLDRGFFFLRRDPSMWSHGAVVLQKEVTTA